MTRFELWCDRNYLDPRWVREGLFILGLWVAFFCFAGALVVAS